MEVSVYRNGLIPCPESYQMPKAFRFHSYIGIRPGHSLIICLPCGPPYSFSCGLFHSAFGRRASGSLIQHRIARFCVTKWNGFRGKWWSNRGNMPGYSSNYCLYSNRAHPDCNCRTSPQHHSVGFTENLIRSKYGSH